MDIIKTKNGKSITISLSGRLDTNSSPELEEEIEGIIDEITELILDFGGLAYISSAGLRVLLSTHKKMTTHGRMIVKNVCENIKEVFDITGFSDILTIE